MSRKLRRVGCFAVLALMIPVTARGDATVLLGLMSVDGVRPAFGVSFGHRPYAVGFEIEYLGTLATKTAERPSAGGIFASAIVKLGTASNVDLFALAGFGIWGETFADGTGTGAVGAMNFGGAALIPLAGPLKARLDYRLFRLEEPRGASRPLRTRFPQRISAGLHLDF